MEKDFKQAVDSNDKQTVRLLLSNELMLDPRGNEFSVMLAYARDNIVDLFVEDDNHVHFYSKSRDTWDINFLNKVKNTLDSNFSKEMLSFYEQVAKKVLQNKTEQLNMEDQHLAEEKKRESDRHTSSEGRQNRKKERTNPKKERSINTYIGTAIGGSAALAIVGLCVGKSALLWFGTAGVVIGSILILTNQKK